MKVQNQTSEIFLTAKDYLVTQKEFDLCWNPQKDMLVTSPIPSQEELGKYYKSDAYISHTDASKTLVDKLYQTVKKRSLNRKLSLVTKYAKGKNTLLDIGAGTGDFLQLAKSKGWSISGIETNADAVARAASKQIELLSNSEELGNNIFSVITLWHVLEHLPNPEARIAEYFDLLEKDGVLIIAVPNFKSWDAKHYKNIWAAYDVPRHLYHFSKESLHRLAGEKYKMEAIKPMYFDSFYVSLLSERYKNSWSPLINGFINGLRSNLAGMRSKEYSSQIYVLRKLK
ncbi:MAG: class I SAM-dependent methyltransferase [Gilvibacter sp.]